MLLNLNALNEALEKKYGIVSETEPQTLNESTSHRLDERFSDSMPKWLKDRLGFTMAAQGSYSNEVHARDKYPEQDSNLWAKRPRGKYGRESQWTLGPMFLEAGIDLNKVDVVEAPVPSKVPRQSKKQQIIPIFLFPNGQVWAKGINDREECSLQGSGHQGETFKSIPNEDIISNAIAYAYIDLSAKGATNDIRAEREKLRREVEAIPNYYRHNHWHHDVDKSGYARVNVPRYKKIADQLAKKRKYKDLPNLIDECEEKINDTKSQILSIFDETELLDVDLMADIVTAVRDFKDACRNYKDTVTRLTNIPDINNIDPDDYNATYEADAVLFSIKETNQELKRVENNIGRFFKVTADW